MPGTRGTYRRVLLKLSGEVFGGDKGIGVDPDVVQDIAKQIADVARTGVQVAIVVGGEITSAELSFLSEEWIAHALTTWECSEQS